MPPVAVASGSGLDPAGDHSRVAVRGAKLLRAARADRERNLLRPAERGRGRNVHRSGPWSDGAEDHPLSPSGCSPQLSVACGHTLSGTGVYEMTEHR